MKIKDIDNNIEDVEFIGEYCYNVSFKHFIDTDSSNFYFSKPGKNFRGPHKCFQGRPYICLSKHIPTVNEKIGYEYQICDFCTNILNIENYVYSTRTITGDDIEL